MTQEELREAIASLVTDIEYCYNGVDGAICPINAKHIDLSYGEDWGTYASVDDAMNAKILNGKSLNDVCQELTIY
ncbi:MAG: hypothetical protein SO119_05725 [Phascolarctobacterium sp.]|nr:hypothetical protein [Phascolarctobacterium sp.]